MSGQLQVAPSTSPGVAQAVMPAITNAQQTAFFDHLLAGCEVREALERVGVTARALYALRRDDAAFRVEWERVLDELHAWLEMDLLARARTGAETVATVEVIDGVRTTTTRKMDDRLAYRLLIERRKGAGRQDKAKDGEESEPAAMIARLRRVVDGLRPVGARDAPGGEQGGGSGRKASGGERHGGCSAGGCSAGEGDAGKRRSEDAGAGGGRAEHVRGGRADAGAVGDRAAGDAVRRGIAGAGP